MVIVKYKLSSFSVYLKAFDVYLEFHRLFRRNFDMVYVIIIIIIIIILLLLHYYIIFLVESIISQSLTMLELTRKLS